MANIVTLQIIKVTQTSTHEWQGTCQNKIIVESGIDCMELCVDGSLGVVGGWGLGRFD